MKFSTRVRLADGQELATEERDAMLSELSTISNEQFFAFGQKADNMDFLSSIVERLNRVAGRKAVSAVELSNVTYNARHPDLLE